MVLAMASHLRVEGHSERHGARGGRVGRDAGERARRLEHGGHDSLAEAAGGRRGGGERDRVYPQLERGAARDEAREAADEAHDEAGRIKALARGDAVGRVGRGASGRGVADRDAAGVVEVAIRYEGRRRRRLEGRRAARGDEEELERL